MTYSAEVKLRQASENNTTSRMAQPKQVMYQHFAEIVGNYADRAFCSERTNRRRLGDAGRRFVSRKEGLFFKARRGVREGLLRNQHSNKAQPESKR